MKKFIRLHIARELTQDELGSFFDIVDTYADIMTVDAYDEDASELGEASIMLMELEGMFIYEIMTNIDPLPRQSKEITIEFSEIVSDDFEISTTYNNMVCK